MIANRFFPAIGRLRTRPPLFLVLPLVLAQSCTKPDEAMPFKVHLDASGGMCQVIVEGRALSDARLRNVAAERRHDHRFARVIGAPGGADPDCVGRIEKILKNAGFEAVNFVTEKPISDPNL